jgi:hypothetical protein
MVKDSKPVPSPVDPKGIAAILVAKKGAPVKDPEDSDDEHSDEILESAGEEVMAAMQAGDAKAFTEALSSFLKICLP